MRRFAFILIFSFSYFLMGGASAQVKIGYLNYNTVLHLLPEYEQTQTRMAELRQKYEQEATRGEEEFQNKFADFLQGQKDFPENILLKRQAELQTLMEAGIKFRQESQKLLHKAEQELLDSARIRLDQAIQAVGLERGLVAVLNTDRHQCPFINPELGEDVTDAVLILLGLKQAEAAEENKE